MGLADALGVVGAKKPKVEVSIAPAFDHFADQAFKSLHANDPASFKDSLKAAIHACLDEYEKQEPDGDEGGKGQY